MKKFVRIVIPVILALAILVCTGWYLFVYDREFTRDMLLGSARYFERQGNHNVAAWFYESAYAQAGNNEAVAIELADQYKSGGNYTKAEYTLSKAIADGGGIDLYIALCKTYVEQDKLLDAVKMLASVSDPQIKESLDAMRPAMPTASPDPGFYSQYISVSVQGEGGTLYVTTDGQYPSTAQEPYAEPITLAEGENTICAITVAQNGLVSPLGIYGYTVGGVIEAVNFADPAIEAEMRNILNVNDSKTLYTNDLWKITELTVPEDAASYDDLKHLTFLESLTIENGRPDQLSFLPNLGNLTTLRIVNTPVSDEAVSAIGKLPLLKSLTLSNCGLTSIAGLGSATGLNYLDLSNNTLRNIEALGFMSALTEVNLSHNALVTVAPLAASTGLKKLDVSYNTLTSTSSFSSLSAITELSISNNALTDLSGIGNLTSLTHLDLGTNVLNAVTELSACTQLIDLNISGNALTDISPLAALTGMTDLNFSHNQVTELPQWSKTCALVRIDGSHNLLTSLDPLSGLENLNNVFMDYNAEITSIDALKECPMLIQVNIYGTKVTDISALVNQSVVVNYDPTQTAQ